MRSAFNNWIFRWPGLLSGSAFTAAPYDGGADDPHAILNLVGEHVYACADGTCVDADIFADGLTLDLTTIPNVLPVRLTAQAIGLTFVGAAFNVPISGGDRITLMRPGATTRLQAGRAHRRTALSAAAQPHS